MTSNNSFKPTPHRGVNSVLCATLHAVATPPRGGLTQALALMLWLTSFQRERNIRRLLTALSRQRVVVVAQPGNFWVIERAPVGLPNQEEAIATCRMRGWIDVLEDAVPKGEWDAYGMPDLERSFKRTEPIYRLTDSGWAVINRVQTWLIATFMVSVLAVLATLLYQ